MSQWLPMVFCRHVTVRRRCCTAQFDGTTPIIAAADNGSPDTLALLIARKVRRVLDVIGNASLRDA